MFTVTVYILIKSFNLLLKLCKVMIITAVEVNLPIISPATMATLNYGREKITDKNRTLNTAVNFINMMRENKSTLTSLIMTADGEGPLKLWRRFL